MTDVQKLHDVLASAGAALASKNYESAIESLTQAVTHAGLLIDRDERREQLFGIFDRRSEAFAKMRNFEAAVGDGLQLCGLRPTESTGYLRVAEALRAANRPSDAIRYLQRGGELCGNPLQIRLIIRAVGSDRRILEASKEEEGPITFDVPDPSSLGLSNFASPARALPEVAEVPSPSPARAAETSAEKQPAADDKNEGNLVAASLIPVAFVIFGLAAALSAPVIVALPVVIGAIIASHAFEADGPHRTTIAFVPLSVWTSGLLAFAITWASPFLSWLSVASEPSAPGP